MKVSPSMVTTGLMLMNSPGNAWDSVAMTAMREELSSKVKKKSCNLVLRWLLRLAELAAVLL